MTRLALPDSSQPATLGAPEVDYGIVDALNAWGPKERPLAAVCALVEEQIAAHLVELLLRRVETMAQSTGRRFRSVSQRAFYLDSQAYEVRVTEHPTEPATVQLAIVKTSAGPEASSPRAPVKLSLDGHGRYSVGMLYVDDDLESIEGDADDDSELLGIYRGVALTERTHDMPLLPDEIAVFRGPINRVARTRHEAVQEVRETVIHELGHYFGLHDDEMPH